MIQLTEHQELAIVLAETELIYAMRTAIFEFRNGGLSPLEITEQVRSIANTLFNEQDLVQPDQISLVFPVEVWED